MVMGIHLKIVAAFVGIFCASYFDLIKAEIFPCKSHDDKLIETAKWIKNQNDDWKYLTLTIQWPESFCISERDAHQSCKIPDAVNNWTLHGLWPSTKPGKGPFECNKTAVFDTTKIEDLLPDMNKYWPTLMNSGTNGSFSFWAHEWCKHGTCAQNLPILQGEHGYFQETLELYHKYNPYSILQSVGIVPSSSRSFSAQDMYKAFKEVLGVEASLGCFKSKTDGRTYIIQVELCIDKGLNVISCPEGFRSSVYYSVPCNGEVYYTPIEKTVSSV